MIDQEEVLYGDWHNGDADIELLGRVVVQNVPPVQSTIMLTCQICLGEEPQHTRKPTQNVNNIIKPCNCRTVHRICLDTWRSTHLGGFAFNQCEICKELYQFEDAQLTPKEIKYNQACLWMQNVWDVLKIVLFIESGAALGAMLFYWMDHHSESIARIMPDQDKMAVYMLFGHLLFLFIIGIVALFVNGCSLQPYNDPPYNHTQTTTLRLQRSNDCFYIGDCGDCDDCCSGSGDGCRDAGFIMLGIIILAIIMFGGVVVIYASLQLISKTWRTRLQESKRKAQARLQRVVDHTVY